MAQLHEVQANYYYMACRHQRPAMTRKRHVAIRLVAITKAINGILNLSPLLPSPRRSEATHSTNLPRYKRDGTYRMLIHWGAPR